MSKNVKQIEGGVEEGVITPAQEAVLLELLKGRTQRDAAAAGQVTEQTVSRWMNSDPVFIAAYNRARASIIEASVNEVLELRREAVKALRELVRDTDPENKWLRLKTAQTILKIEMPAVGPTDPIDVEGEFAKQKRDRQFDELLYGRL